MNPTSDPYGPDRPCRRTACVRDHPARLPAPQGVTADHLGGAHLDPTDRAHYDGLRTSYQAAPLAVRNAVYPLMIRAQAFVERPADNDSPLRADTERALDACFREIDRLRAQVAAVSNDRDRQVRDATDRALDCDVHGEIIRENERSLYHAARERDRTEKARLALLGEHQAITEIMAAYTAMTADGQPPASPEYLHGLLGLITKNNAKTSRAHKRAWENRKET